MSGFIESQRVALEELDVIEEAISQRLSRDPHLLPKSLRPKNDIISKRKSKKSSTLRLSLLQQSELRVFIDKYHRAHSSLEFCLANEKHVLVKQLSNIAEGPKQFTKFDQLIRSISHKETDDRDGATAENPRALYSCFSSITSDMESHHQDLKVKIDKNTGTERELAKRKYILSSIASHLKDTITSEGYLDLTDLHLKYNSHLASAPISYVQYLYIFQSLDSQSKGAPYTQYVKDLSNHLIESFKSLHPLEDFDQLEISWKLEFEETNKISEGQENEKGEVYCKPCEKMFSKMSVYKGHLDGKKHKKNSKNSDASKTNFDSSAWYEFTIGKLTTKLRTDIDTARLHAERISNSSERELLMEQQNLEEIESEFTDIGEYSDAGDDSDEESDDDGSFKSLPVGPDGAPIPFWLYKLQGLDKKYDCEICGNITYKGRQTFLKHFSNVKHQYGLKCLGVEPGHMSFFKNITKIEQAQKLWLKFKRENREKQGELENAIEVEDDEGNVMSEKDYLDLKKQGLL
ncbi:Pre-mRNA-splicing factor sap61 [Spathaspora sp. JA1]|nr:Pre-mRNA-splicing factor sap61 [Spathaspora sp. JA1]